MRAAVIKLALDDLAELLHLPEGTWVDAVLPVHSVMAKEVEIVLRSHRDFLPEVPEGQMAQRGTLNITTIRSNETYRVTFEPY